MAYNTRTTPPYTANSSPSLSSLRNVCKASGNRMELDD